MLNVAVGGMGSPIVLLHGFPQTHLMWRHVAVDLAADHTVICPDLRGGAALGFDAAALWRTWAADLAHRITSAGHFMAEEAPDEIVKVLRSLLAR